MATCLPWLALSTLIVASKNNAIREITSKEKNKPFEQKKLSQ